MKNSTFRIQSIALVVGSICGAVNYSWAATINAKSCVQADVSSAIASAAVGDTVQVPAGSCSWSGLSINKPIYLKGSGVGQTNITITSELSISKQTTGIIRISNFTFLRSGSGSATIGIRVTGSWDAEPVIFKNNKFTVSSATLFRVESPGGFIASTNDFTAGWDDIIFQLKDSSNGNSSWTTADTLGIKDTNGKRNHYIENNTIYGGTNTTVDCDDAARCVYRYNTLTYSGFGSHEYATSPVGIRHFEIYNNTWLYPTSGCSSNLANQNWLARIRGGTGVIFGNTMPNIAIACGWGDKAEIKFDIRGAEDVRPQGTCANTKYPVPRQIGQNHNGTNYFTDPIYIWGNTGTVGFGEGWGWGNPCGFNWSDYFKWGRDAINGTPKPGYTPYTYPHPLVVIQDDPPTGTGLQTPHLYLTQ